MKFNRSQHGITVTVDANQIKGPLLPSLRQDLIAVQQKYYGQKMDAHTLAQLQRDIAVLSNTYATREPTYEDFAFYMTDFLKKLGLRL